MSWRHSLIRADSFSLHCFKSLQLSLFCAARSSAALSFSLLVSPLSAQTVLSANVPHLAVPLARCSLRNRSSLSWRSFSCSRCSFSRRSLPFHVLFSSLSLQSFLLSPTLPLDLASLSATPIRRGFVARSSFLHDSLRASC
jgi:hypothetical protein